MGSAAASFGIAEERAFAGPPAAPPGAPLPGLGADLDGLQLRLRVLHRPVGPGPRGLAPAGRDPRRGRGPRAGGRARADAPRPERQLVRPRPRQQLRRAATGLRRRRGDRADPLHEAAPEGLPRAGDRRDGRARERVRARGPAAPVGLDPRPEGDAPDVFPRALPARRGRAAGGDTRSRVDHRPDRRVPGRERGGVRGDGDRGRGGRLRRGLHLRLSAAPGPRPPRCRTRCPKRSSASGSSG